MEYHMTGQWKTSKATGEDEMVTDGDIVVPAEHPEDEDSTEKLEVAPEEEGHEMEIKPEQYEIRGDPIVTTFKDHFTLTIPSSTIRFREAGTGARIVEGRDRQFVIEETFDHENDKKVISVRSIGDATSGVKFLRLTYTIFCLFWVGFLFVFSLQIILFIFIDLAIKAGATSVQSRDTVAALGAIFSMPGYIYGLASALVLAGAFVADTWEGHPLIRNFTLRNMDSASVEWIFFFFFLGSPVLVMCITLLAGTNSWWTFTCLYWFVSVVAFYCVFTVNVVFYEMSACWEVSEHFNPTKDTFWAVLRQSIMLRQISTYSGRRHVSYLSKGTIIDSEYTDKSARDNTIGSTYRDSVTLRARFTRLFISCGLYSEVNERFHTIDDARDVRPFVTYYTWGLEKLFCRPRDSRFIGIVRGPGAITPEQMMSSIVCSFLGTALMFLVIISFLVYLQAGAAATVFLVAMGLLIASPSLASTYRLYKTSQGLRTAVSLRKGGINDDDVEETVDPNESEAVYLVQESYRCTKPSQTFCWCMFGVEVFFLFGWPLVSLLRLGNYKLVALFILAAGVTTVRYYINAAVVLEEIGHLNVLKRANEEELWKSQSRLSRIVGDVTRGRSRGAWMVVLGFVGLAFFGLMLGAVGMEQDSLATFDIPFTYLTDFEYIPENSMRYPTCDLSSYTGGGPLTSMADFAYLAGHAYRGVNVSQRELDGWFNGTVVDEINYVEAYRSAESVSSAVSFKLVTVPGADNFAYVLIRGTTNNWDVLTDAQLWSAAFLLQCLRELLPIGYMFSPIMDFLIHAITELESEAISQVSFYVDTSAFTETVKADTQFGGTAITGHSLGGGLSIITGSQTKTPAIALSGPNAMLSRKSFTPKISADDINTWSFNIIPSRDIVPKIDDPGQNIQIIRCQAGFSDIVGCHDSTRSLCEIQSTCGSNGRPVLCECAKNYSYPEPTPIAGVNNGRTFAEACGL